MRCFDLFFLGCLGFRFYFFKERVDVFSIVRFLRSFFFRGSRVRFLCRWSGWGGCGILWSVSGGVFVVGDRRRVSGYDFINWGYFFLGIVLGINIFL